MPGSNHIIGDQAELLPWVDPDIPMNREVAT